MKNGVVVLLALMVSVVVLADPGEGRRGDRARTYLVVRISEELELTDEQALEVSRVLLRSGERRAELHAKRRALNDELRAALDKSDEAGIEQLVGEAYEIDRAHAQVAVDSFKEIETGLTVKQRGQLTLLVPEMQRQLRRGVRRMLGEREAGRGQRPRD
jgi:hypothetical protein